MKKLKGLGLILASVLIALASNAASSGTALAVGEAAAPKVVTGGKRVIDLGQLEVEGELRRPPVNWIGNMKGLKELLPSLYANEFKRLEEQLLKPAKKQADATEQGKEKQRVSN